MNPLILWGILVGMNILDGFTTYLSLHKLPEDLKAKEMNPLFNQMGINKRFRNSMFFKAFLVLGSLILIPWDPIRAPYVYEILILVFVFVIINNSYIYLFRRYKKRKVWTLGSFLKSCLIFIKVPDRFAGGLAFLVMMVALVWIAAGILTLVGG